MRNFLRNQSQEQSLAPHPDEMKAPRDAGGAFIWDCFSSEIVALDETKDANIRIRIGG